MNTIKHILVGACLVGGLIITPVTAAPVYTSYRFTAGMSPVFDISGNYDLEPVVDGDIPVSFNVSITQDSKGNLTGSGPTAVTIDSENVRGAYTVKGKIFRASGRTKISALVKLSGSGFLQGQQRTFSLVENYSLNIDQANHLLTGVGRGTAKAQGIGEAPCKDVVNVPLPDAHDGTWDLELLLSTEGKNVTGTAQATLKTGRQVDFNAKGTYNSKTGKSTVILTGIAPDTNSRLKVVGTGSPLNIISVTGLLLGQVVK